MSKRNLPLPNTALEFLRNKSHLEGLIRNIGINTNWFSSLFTLDILDEFVVKATAQSPTYFENKVILNREGLLAFIKTQFPQGFDLQYAETSKYGADFIDNLILETTFSIIFDKSYGTCSGQIGERYAIESFNKIRKNLNTFDIAIILEVNTSTNVGASLLSSYDSLSEYKKTLAPGEEVDIEKYHEFLGKPHVQKKIREETIESQAESDFEDDNDNGKEFKNEFHIINHVKNLLKDILEVNKILAFIIPELGECKLPRPKYPLEDVWSINLICGGTGGNGAYLISLFLFSVISGAQMGKWPPIGVLELAGGYENTAGLCLYTKFGFKVDSSIRGPYCFSDYHNLPHIADFRPFDLDATSQTMINLITSKTPIPPFYKNPLCYIKNPNLQIVLAIMLNIKDSKDVLYYFLLENKYIVYFERALYILLNKKPYKDPYTHQYTENDLNEIIRLLFSMSQVNPVDIENTYSNSISSLTADENDKINYILTGKRPAQMAPQRRRYIPPPKYIPPPPSGPRPLQNPQNPLQTPPPSPPPSPPSSSSSPSPGNQPPCNPRDSSCYISGGRKRTRKIRRKRRTRKQSKRHHKKSNKKSK